MKGIEVIDVDMDKMRSQIGAIKGIGETRLNQIMNIIRSNAKVSATSSPNSCSNLCKSA